MPKKRSKGSGEAKNPSTKSKFSAKQGQYLAYLYWYHRLHRHAPSEREIAEFFGISPTSAHQMIARLEQKGLIERTPKDARSIRVLVPFSELPDLESEEEEPLSAPPPANKRAAQGITPKLYTLEVFLVGGPLPEELAGKEISRTIQIRGDQTLEQLHEIIFQAYDRWDEHMYEFQFGRGPHDPNGQRYVLPMVTDGENIAGDLTQTTIDSLNLEVNQPFGYWFDFGDDWYHQIVPLAIDDNVPRATLPRVIERVGDSPPQYCDSDE